MTVAAQAMNSWVGALGGMFILVSYFLTAAISCLSAIQYFSVVLPAIGPVVLEITIAVLLLLGLLNWVGISESAKVSLVGALIAFGSDLAIIWTVFTHIPISELPLLFSKMFMHTTLTPTAILVGFAGAFLAFSGLESISQLSPAIAEPRRRVVQRALRALVATMALTSPVLTLWSTTVLPITKTTDPNQFISLLAGYAAGHPLEEPVARRHQLRDADAPRAVGIERREERRVAVQVAQGRSVADQHRAGLQEVAGWARRELGARADADLPLVDVDRRACAAVGVEDWLRLDPAASDPELAERRPMRADEEAADDRFSDAESSAPAVESPRDPEVLDAQTRLQTRVPHDVDGCLLPVSQTVTEKVVPDGEHLHRHPLPDGSSCRGRPGRNPKTVRG